MTNKRIYQIAKELNIAHHHIVSFLENKGIKVSNHMMPVDSATYSSILMEFSKLGSKKLSSDYYKFWMKNKKQPSKSKICFH